MGEPVLVHLVFIFVFLWLFQLFQQHEWMERAEFDLFLLQQYDWNSFIYRNGLGPECVEVGCSVLVAGVLREGNVVSSRCVPF